MQVTTTTTTTMTSTSTSISTSTSTGVTGLKVNVREVKGQKGPTDQPKVVHEVLADLKRKCISWKFRCVERQEGGSGI